MLTRATSFDSFPSFCALLVGGSKVVPILFYRFCALVVARFRLRGDILASQTFVRLTRFVSAFLCSWFCSQILNRKHDRLQRGYGGLNQGAPNGETALAQSETAQQEHGTLQFAGRTLDLTLFTVTRAVDVLACIAWAHWHAWRKARNQWTFLESAAPKLADTAVFAASSAVIMWAWFYLPERLPRSYEKWIGEVAKVDSRLVEALRRARRGVFVYGKDTGQAPLLQSMCEDYKWPLEWGDPVKTIPLPCEMVHMGCGPSCEKHAAYRFFKTFKFTCATYLPLQMAVRLRKLRSKSALVRAVSDAMRSSAFLASFVSIFYYSVCLARTRLGPMLFDKNTVTPLMWDSGLCVGAGCVMCGWSILAERAHKRQEIALFVAPRAAATVLPRVYDKQVWSMEQNSDSFSLISFGAVVTLSSHFFRHYLAASPSFCVVS